ncbi:Holliday junction resolvase RuvX [Porphyromonas sp.]|uniref:Holliday junction resolvase RuvX n=1 Tax=Porphyromonas sp. TaxID=1924944 RepID=UPI0026DC31AB|nr:Holliday junction resolvase RuvX [Porphyromonas sp.]MDO4695484.1 Holliday junction resolvase RuvX [Porphyromonas sp.]MDO4770282.1 Holliday junction resolvase RuvX [Porphyromonas sp.]
MGRLVAIDIGRKRTGIAATDIMQIVPGGLGYLPTHQVPAWLEEYCKKEPVDKLIIGEPKQANYSDSESVKYINPVINRIRKVLPNLEIVRYDERYTSVLAHQTMIEAGLKQHKRREKGLVDEISAVIILRDYMEHVDCMSGKK